MKKIIILGSTGSIGKQTLEIIKRDRKKFKIVLLSTDKNINLITKQIKFFKVKNIVVTNYKKYRLIKKKLKNINIFPNFMGLIVVLDKLIFILFDLTPKVPIEATFMLLSLSIW